MNHSQRKIALITFVGACNYGAALQGYALRTVLARLSGDAVVVPAYYPAYFVGQYRQTLVHGWKIALLLHLKWRTWWHEFCIKWSEVRRNLGFRRFVRRRIGADVMCRTGADIVAALPDTRIWVTGSDQVWSPTCAGFDPVFFLDLPLPEGSRKYSYAASLGNITEVPADICDEMKRRLKGYSAYSVREQVGADIVSRLTGQEVQVHCDPSLLLTADEWSNLAPRKRKKGYILVYHVTKHEPLLQEAARLSEKTGLPVIVFSSYFGWQDIGGEMRRKYRYTPAMHSSPEDFVALFRDAAYVITNSFHGTAFSLLFHKEFFSLTVDADGKRNERAINLLESVGVDPNRRIGDAPIDWQNVDVRMACLRRAAFEYLQRTVCADV